MYIELYNFLCTGVFATKQMFFLRGLTFVRGFLALRGCGNGAGASFWRGAASMVCGASLSF